MNEPTAAGQVTYEMLQRNFQAEVVAANGDQTLQGKAIRDFTAGTQRLALQDKYYEALAQVFSTHPELLIGLAKNIQQIGQRAADASIESDKGLYDKMQGFLLSVDQANFDLDLTSFKGRSVIARLAGTLSEVCHLVGFDDGAEYLDNYVNNWESRNNVKATPDKLDSLKGKMVPETKAPISAVTSATNEALNGLSRDGNATVATVARDVASGINDGAKLPEPITGQTVASPKEVAELARETIETIGKSVGLTAYKIKEIVGAYEATSGSNSIMDEAAEITAFDRSKAMKDLRPEQKSALEQGLKDQHLIPT